MTVTTPNTRSRRKINRSDLGMQIFLFTIGLIIATPILIAIFTSFKSLQDISANPTAFLPREWTFRNYITAWNATPFGRYLINSIIQSFTIVFFQAVFSVLAAFAFSFLEFPGRNFIFYLILGSLMVPFQLTFIPNFVMVSHWGLANT